MITMSTMTMLVLLTTTTIDKTHTNATRQRKIVDECNEINNNSNNNQTYNENEIDSILCDFLFSNQR